MKSILYFLGAALLGAAAVYFYMNSSASMAGAKNGAMEKEGAATTTEEMMATSSPETTIGSSVNGTPIVAYHFSDGTKEVLFVGGVHGSYSWSTAKLAREIMAYLKATPSAIPAGVRVTVIPELNPDGLTQTQGSVTGRFNAHQVDLNRNFDCDWKEKGVWQSKEVSGGTAPFSEPESAALKTYVESHPITAAVVWFSAGGGVYASSCGGAPLAETVALTDVLAQASGYKAHQTFDSYEVNGDMVNWLAKKGIPGVSILLTKHDGTEWEKNKKGIDALLARYAQ